MSVQFIFDWIPSYLLVISKVHKKPNQTPINSPKNNEVAQDEARPAVEFDDKEDKGEVIVRILTISMRDDEQNEDSKSQDQDEKNYATPLFNDKGSLLNQQTHGVVPSPLEMRQEDIVNNNHEINSAKKSAGDTTT